MNRSREPARAAHRRPTRSESVTGTSHATHHTARGPVVRTTVNSLAVSHNTSGPASQAGPAPRTAPVRASFSWRIGIVPRAPAPSQYIIRTSGTLFSKTMLGRFLRGPKPTGPNSARPLAPAVRDAILAAAGSRGIPPMPGAAHRAFELSVNPGAEASDFVALVEEDEALSARVLKLANSVFFDRGSATTTIEAAVVLIGTNELRCLLNSIALRELFPSPSPHRALLWEHDVAVAIGARVFASRLEPSAAGLAFIAGLMHDIGKLLLLQRSGPDYARVVRLVEDSGLPYSEAEAEVYPFDHTEAGQLVAERWNFPADLTDAIRNHHLPWDRLDTGPAATRLVKAADAAVHALGFAHPRGHGKLRKRYEESLDECREGLELGAAEWRELLEAAKRAIDAEKDLYAGGG